jgi:hypothetical protein
MQFYEEKKSLPDTMVFMWEFSKALPRKYGNNVSIYEEGIFPITYASIFSVLKTSSPPHTQLITGGESDLFITNSKKKKKII